MFAFGSWQGTAGSQRLELTVANVGTTGYHCKELPVPRSWNSWFPTWEPWVTIARNCRFPEVGTPDSQPGNHGLPLQETAGYQRLELTVANVGTTGYHCKELPVPRSWNSWFPTWEPWVTIARNCRFPPGNQRLPLQATDGSQRLELMLPNLGTIGYHCKELPIPQGWNWWFPTWEPKVTMARNCRFPDLETYGSQPGNQRLLLQGIAGSQKLEFMFSKLSGYHCKELRVPIAWNSWFQDCKSNVTSGRICWLQKVKTHGS